MKYICQYSDRLEQAYRTIGEQEAEIRRLRKELSRLQVSTRPQSSKSDFSNDNVPSPRLRYAQPARSSQLKTVSESETPKNRKEPSHRVMHINGNIYIYNNGVPISAKLDENYQSYMKPTIASSERSCQACR